MANNRIPDWCHKCGNHLEEDQTCKCEPASNVEDAGEADSDDAAVIKANELGIKGGLPLTCFIDGWRECKKAATHPTQGEEKREEAGAAWKEYIKQFPELYVYWDRLPPVTNLWLAQQIDIFAGKYPAATTPNKEGERGEKEAIELLKDVIVWADGFMISYNDGHPILKAKDFITSKPQSK